MVSIAPSTHCENDIRPEFMSEDVFKQFDHPLHLGVNPRLLPVEKYDEGVHELDLLLQLFHHLHHSLPIFIHLVSQAWSVDDCHRFSVTSPTSLLSTSSLGDRVTAASGEQAFGVSNSSVLRGVRATKQDVSQTGLAS